MGWPQGKTPKGFNWCHFASMSMHHGNWGNITNYHILIRVLRTWENLQWWDSLLLKGKRKRGKERRMEGWKEGSEGRKKRGEPIYFVTQAYFMQANVT